MEVDASDPDRDQFRRSHAGEEQSVQEREVWVVRAGLVNSTDFPAPGAEVAKDFIAFFLGERRRSRNDLFGPAHFWKWKRHREVILLRVTHHGTERSQSSARFRRTARAATASLIYHLLNTKFPIATSTKKDCASRPLRMLIANRSDGRLPNLSLSWASRARSNG